MYPITLWKDHAIVPERTYTLTDNGDGTVTLVPYGTVVQQGTNMSAANFNNIETEVFAGDLASRLMLFIVRRDGDRLTVSEADIAQLNADLLAEVTAEEKTVSITNTAKYPNPSTQVTVSLSTTRRYLNYTVEAEVTTFNGNVGEVEITDKQLNGFKVRYTGSAKSATIKLKIRGGMLA